MKVLSIKDYLPGESVFILRARDVLAVPAVKTWIEMARLCGVSSLKIGDARGCCEVMEHFVGKRVPGS